MKKDSYCDSYCLTKGIKIILLKMKITTLFLILTVLSANASMYSQNIAMDLQVNNKSVREILKMIENQSDFRFVYNDDFADLNKTFNGDFKAEGIENILGQLLENSNVTYKILENNVVVITPVKENIHKQVRITGTIKDASTGESLPGVNIQIQGSTQGTISDTEGKYTLQVNESAGNLIFSYVGYATRTITLTGQTVIDVELVLDVLALEEVLVIGYGVQKKSLVTGAIATVSGEDMGSSSITRAEQALQGRSAGVQVISTSGAPGSEMKVRIRGYSSNANADPLYIVDGVKTANISHIPPQDIVNMEVLKDAASSAIYGAEGANGVVIITTRKGKSGYTSVDYDFQYTFQNIGRTPEMLNAQEYAAYQNEIGAISIDAASLKYNTDWMKEVTEVGYSKRHYLSFSSGNERSNFLFSVSSLNQDGIIKMDKDKYKRYTFRLNADAKVTDWLKVGNNASFAATELSAVTEDSETKGIIASSMIMDPTMPVIYTGDDILPSNMQTAIDQGKKLVKDGNDNYYAISQYLINYPINPFVSLELGKEKTTKYVLNGNMFAELTPIEHVVFTSRLGYEIASSMLKGWNPAYYYNVSSNNAQSNISANYTIGKYWQWENFISYTNTFAEDHSVNIMAGMSAEARITNYALAVGGPMIQENADYA